MKLKKLKLFDFLNWVKEELIYCSGPFNSFFSFHFFSFEWEEWRKEENWRPFAAARRAFLLSFHFINNWWNWERNEESEGKSELKASGIVGWVVLFFCGLWAAAQPMLRKRERTTTPTNQRKRVKRNEWNVNELIDGVNLFDEIN